MPIPSRTADRLSTGLKKYQPILAAAKSRDVFAKLMTAEQIAEAQLLAREWTQKRQAGAK